MKPEPQFAFGFDQTLPRGVVIYTVEARWRYDGSGECHNEYVRVDPCP